MANKNHQAIHDKIDGIFEGFVSSNRSLFGKMGYNGVIDVHQANKDKKLHAINMLGDPFNVAYIGLNHHGEGHLIAFIDKSFNKIYHYYDVT